MSKTPRDTPRLAEPLKEAALKRLKRAVEASGLTMDKLPKKAGVSRAALFRALRGEPVLARTRGKLIAWTQITLAKP